MNVRVLACALMVAFLGAFSASRALADIGPPPQCPAGLAPAYWEGHYCAPIECSNDGDCGREKCVERSVCLFARDRSNLPNTDKRYEYRGECGTAGTCSGGACVSKKVCTTRGGDVPGTDSPASSKRGCGCSVPGGDVGAVALVLSIVAGVGLAIGRRRRPRG